MKSLNEILKTKLLELQNVVLIHQVQAYSV